MHKTDLDQNPSDPEDSGLQKMVLSQIPNPSANSRDVIRLAQLHTIVLRSVPERSLILLFVMLGPAKAAGVRRLVILALDHVLRTPVIEAEHCVVHVLAN